MEQDSSKYNNEILVSTKTLVLDYLFGEGKEMDAYQLVRFSEAEDWNVLASGYLLGSIRKVEGIWCAVNTWNLGSERITLIGEFIDHQHFNLLPEKIRIHWEEYVHQVIVQNDNLYLVVAHESIEFGPFKRMFMGFISELVEDPWPITFKVYNADFTDEFIVEVS